MNETYPEHEIGAEIEIVAGDDFLRGAVLGINYMCPVYMYVVQLDEPIESEFGEQTGLYVPESVLVGEPDSETLTSTSSEGKYVRTTDDGAVDVTVRVKTTLGEDAWYVVLTDIEGEDFFRLTPFDTEAEANEVAATLIEENHEAGPGENAEQYLARLKEESDNA